MVSDLDRKVLKNRSVLVAQGSTGFTLKDLLDKDLDENNIILVKKLVDAFERNNVTLNYPIPNHEYVTSRLKSQEIIKENKQ